MSGFPAEFDNQERPGEPSRRAQASARSACAAPAPLGEGLGNPAAHHDVRAGPGARSASAPPGPTAAGSGVRAPAGTFRGCCPPRPVPSAGTPGQRTALGSPRGRDPKSDSRCPPRPAAADQAGKTESETAEAALLSFSANPGFPGLRRLAGAAKTGARPSCLPVCPKVKLVPRDQNEKRWCSPLF